MPTVEERLSQWQQELLDLSNRNRLLNFRPSTTRPSSIQLLAPPLVDLYQSLSQGRPLGIVGRDQGAESAESEEVQISSASRNGGNADEDGLTTAGKINVTTDASGSPSPGPTTRTGTVLASMPVERTNRVALRLLARARVSEQEQGINTLFATFGLLKWQEKPGEATWRYAPLVLLPLKIEENTREGAYRITATGDDPEFNQTLTERLKRDFGLAISVDVDEETDLGSVFAEVRSLVAKQPGWEILDQAHIGHFQFHKLRMFRDLAEHAAVGSQHPIVQALATDGATIAPLPEGIPAEEDLDRAVAPQHSFTVLDADASQLWAIQAATRGANLIIQGPPGTGKSQTIANIIAECIAAGKTVLFVSEKAAAIEVVHRRLTERGLGDFCLMLHSQKANKRDVVYTLGARLNLDLPPPSSPHEDLDLKRLEETRGSLNSYAAALHRPRDPLRESAFWVHSELASLHDVPYLVAAPPRMDDLTLEQLDNWKRLIEQVSRFRSIVEEGEAHPWAGIRRRDLTLGDQASLRHTLVALRAALPEIRLASQLLADHLRLPVPETLQDAQNLARLAGVVPPEGGLRPAWLDPVSIRQTEALAAEAVGHARAARELADRLFATYGEGILGAATPETIASYERGGLARFFSRTHRQFRAQVRQAAKDGQQRPVPDELVALRTAFDLQQQLAWFRERETTLLDTLGLSIEGSASPDPAIWGRTAMEVSSAAAILARLPSGPVPVGFVEEMCRVGIGSTIRPFQLRLEAAIAKMDRDVESLGTFLDVTALQDGGGALAGARFDQVEEWLGQRLSRFDDLDPWLRAQIALGRAKDAGLTEVIHQLVVQEVPPDCWTNAFHRLILTHWLDGVYREDDTLRNFRGDEHEATVAQFRALDRRYIGTSAQRIRRVLASRQVRVSAAHGGEPGLLRHEAGKRKRHIPLRRLFERIPNLLPTLKPCLMMSPLSVAQFLPADRYRFDVVVFDEASQVRPHDAIGAIMRGKQLVVAGDSKQLPPTAFFDRSVDDGTVDDEQDLRALESILDGLGTRGMPPASLLWHYRSRHEDLIAFSNQHFYSRALVTFPSPTAERSPGLGVRLDYVPDGRYEDVRDKVLGTPVRVNRIEAQRVARLVMHHARTRTDESLGVVTLGTNQREEVEEAIKQARMLDQSLDDFFRPDKPDPFFVKALEQVQGDERDVIMISIGYGKNAQGVLSHNFGPINQDGGERRLNVLVTRARLQVIVVSSIRAGDIDLSRTSKLGPRLLKNYLDFAERGQVALEAETIGGDGDYESPFEEEVGEALMRAGYTVHRQVGSSKFRIDLAIVDPRQPGRYLLGIECDGRTYHQSKTARDRDRLRQEILEGLGWTIHRVWSTDWIRQPDRELDRVIARVEELLDSEEGGADLELSVPVDSDEIEPATSGQADDFGGAFGTLTPGPARNVDVFVDREHLKPLAVPYRVAALRLGQFGDILAAPMSLMADVVAACVEVEAPIHRDLLSRRIVTAWGYQRAGARIAAKLAQAISVATQQGRLRQQGDFLWPALKVEVVPRGPASDGTIRDITHIADEEIIRGMTLLLEHAFSLPEDELIVQTSRLFGYQRTGSDINRRLREMLRAAVMSGLIMERGERYQLPSK